MRTAPGSPPAYLCAAAALAVSLLAASCSGHVPELGGVEFRLAVRPPAPGGGRGAEQLAVFVAARDKDGFRDLAALHILHDVEELLWTLTPETWTRGDLGKETWIGATGLSVPEVGTLPRGLYRVILEDLAGDSDTISFTLGSGLERGAAFPTLRRIGDSVA
ncbi:MAG TPA: hypothetical protein VLH39_00280, partial [Magnetospirillaceae bacterium]|nr:hypothetical protein [Magnetospirillaceae bacterium]